MHYPVPLRLGRGLHALLGETRSFFWVLPFGHGLCSGQRTGRGGTIFRMSGVLHGGNTAVHGCSSA